MTNREYLEKELPLWLFNRLVANTRTNNVFATPEEGRDAFDWTETKRAAKIEDVFFAEWKSGGETMKNIFEKLWLQDKDFLFPCTFEEALSILELVEPEFYEFVTQRRREQNDTDNSIVTNWFTSFLISSFVWGLTVEGSNYWSNKTDFSVSPQWLEEKSKFIVKSEPQTIGEWLDLPENALIKKIFEFDRIFLDDRSGAIPMIRTIPIIRASSINSLYFSLPSRNSGVDIKCRDAKSFQPYIDWYNNHPQNPNKVSSVKLEDINEPHTLEWWRDELAKTEPEVAAHLYGEYVKQGRTTRNPRKLFGDNILSFLGGIDWSNTEIGYVIHRQCFNNPSWQPLKDALLKAKKAIVTPTMKGATFPCTVDERLEWMLTQPELKPIAEFIKQNGATNRDCECHGEFRNNEGFSFAYICSSRGIIDTDCHSIKSWEPFFDKYPHLRVKTAKTEKAINPHKQLMVECKDIKEVKQLLKYVDQESAFTHSQRLVVVYDLETQQIFHVGSTKKSHWKQILNKVHKRVTAEEFMSEVPQVKPVVSASKRQKYFGIQENPCAEISLPSDMQSPRVQSWFDEVPITAYKTTSWFD